MLKTLVFLLSCACVLGDYYELLGITRDANARAIKKAFRKLSLKYHPDRNPGDAAAAEKFGEIKDAYEVLSDEEKKFLYDEGGEKALQADSQGGGQDPFAMFFGGGNKRNRNKGPDAKMGVEVTLEQLYNGQMVKKTISRLVHCKGCKEEPHTPRCRNCRTRCPNEIKMVQRQMAPGFVMNQQTEVASQEKCTMEETALEIMLERGMANGETVTFRGKSERRPGQIPGDLHVVLKERPHRVFKRDGNDLHYTMHISLREALLGFSHVIAHLDDHTVTVQSQGITKPFEVRRMKDEGMPQHNFPSQKGYLFVKFIVDFPAKLSAVQRQKIEAAF